MICACTLCLFLVGCGNSKGYVEMPSGTYDGNNFIIYTPDATNTPVEGTTISESVAEVSTETTAPEVNKVDNYAERYQAFYARYSVDNLYMEFSILKTNHTEGATEKTSYTVAYLDNLSYVKTTDNIGNTSTVISNSKVSYLVDYDNKIAEKAELGTFPYANRSDINLLFTPSEGSYTGTVEKMYNDITYSVDTYVYKDTDVEVYYDTNDELIMVVIANADTEKCCLFERVTLCESKEIFKLSKDYTIKDYEER